MAIAGIVINVNKSWMVLLQESNSSLQPVIWFTPSVFWLHRLTQLATMSMRERASSNGVIHDSQASGTNALETVEMSLGSIPAPGVLEGQRGHKLLRDGKWMFHSGKVLLTPHSQVWQETSCARLGLSYHFPSLQEDPSSHLAAFYMECPRLAPGSLSFCTLPGVEGVRILGMSSFSHWAFLPSWSPVQQPQLYNQKLWLD